MAQSDMVFDKWGIITFMYTLFIVILVATIVGSFIYYSDVLVGMFKATSASSGSFQTPGVDSIRVSVIGVLLLTLCICTSRIFSAILKLNTEFEVGRRKQDECGMEYPESSTGRYALSLEYNDQKKIITDSLTALMSILFISLGIMLALDAYRLYVGQPPAGISETSELRRQNVKRGSLIAVAALIVFWSGGVVTTLSKYMNDPVAAPVVFSVGLFSVIVFSAFVSYMNGSIADIPPTLFAYTIVCVISFVLYALVRKSALNLSDAMTQYTAHTVALQDNIVALLSKYPKDPQNTIIKKHITRNIMRDDNGAEGNTEYIYSQYSNNSKLWPYISHRNWNELKEVATLDDSCPNPGSC